MRQISVGIIGAGLIGSKRAKAIAETGLGRLYSVADIDKKKAKTLAKTYGSHSTDDWKEVVNNRDVNLVIVSTVNKFLKPISIAALKAGKHVLCEKPLGRNAVESTAMVKAAQENDVLLKCGFNHRFHPAIQKAHKICREGSIGELTHARCVYGHGGRPGYDSEWRANKRLCGGGELLDQGVHVVDLFRYFLGDFHFAIGMTPTLTWNMPVEDNGFALFISRSGIVAQMHTSWTQWKNRFLFEIFGKTGYCSIEGLGGSYGAETLSLGLRALKGGPPQEKIETFEKPDLSWNDEWRNFYCAINDNQPLLGDGNDGLAANFMLGAVYKSGRTHKREIIMSKHIDFKVKQ
jgi:predicted dehydrogenase